MLSVPTHRPRQDHALHVAAELDQLVGREGVVDADHVLLDDRALVEILGDVVGGGADQLNAASVGLVVGLGTLEGRQERVVDVDDAAAEAGYPSGRGRLVSAA